MESMNAMNRDAAALVLVDYQARLMPAIAGAERVVAEAVFLADVARLLAVPVVGTAQNPAGLGPNVAAVAERCDCIVEKTRFDACADGLLDALRAARPGLTQVVLAGCEAHVCLTQTALGLRRAGLELFIVASACGSRAPADHALAMQRLAQAGATIVVPEMVAFEWLRSSAEPAFGAVLALVKARPVVA